MRHRMRALGLAVTTVVATGVAVPLLTSGPANAARFTGGNLVVYRVGSGGSALTNAATPVFLDEFTPAGTKIQSIALPTAASNGNLPLTATGESRSEGLIARSSDGRFLTVTGYDAAPGTTGPSGTSLAAATPTVVPRVVGIVDANGIADTSTKLTGASTPQIIRSAVSTNGDRLWVAGGNGGVATTTLGGTVSTVAGGDASNLSSLTIANGQLFASGILTNRLAAVGTGTPASSASFANVPGLPDNLLTYGYAFEDLTGAGYAGTTLDTLYIANASSRGGTVDKYRYNGSTWVLAGSVEVPGAFGLVADENGSDVSLAVTTPTQLLSLTDTGAAGTSLNVAPPSVLATAAANTEFRGVALAPTAAGGPSVFVRKPATNTTVDLSTGTVTVSAFVDSPDGVASVQVQLGTSAVVDATQGTGKVWTAKIPAAGLTAGTATLSVTATDQAASPGTTTVKRKIVLSGSSVPTGDLGAGTYAWSAKKITLTGAWTTYNTATSPTGKGETSGTKGDTAKAKIYGKKLVLSFTKAKNAGKVQVTVDGAPTTIDLYSATKGSLTHTWTFAGALATHSVSVKVLGTKNASSTGKAVFLAALEVA